MHEPADLLERQPGPLRGGDHGEPAQHHFVVATLAADPFGRRQESDALVVADQRRAHAGSACHLTDAQHSVARWLPLT